jgi:hypothetical protein
MTAVLCIIQVNAEIPYVLCNLLSEFFHLCFISKFDLFAQSLLLILITRNVNMIQYLQYVISVCLWRLAGGTNQK